MRILVLGFFAVLALAAWTGSARAQECSAVDLNAQLNFEIPPVRPIYNSTVSIAGIRNMFRMHGQSPAGPHAHTLGVTFATPLFKVSGHARSVPHDDGFCFFLDAVDVKFGFQSEDVYVASDYLPASCEYRVIIDHENQHVFINDSVVRSIAPKVRAVVEQALAAQTPVFVLDPEAGPQRALDRLSLRVDSTLAEFREILAYRNGALDTADSYGASAAMCHNWNLDNLTAGFNGQPNAPIQAPAHGLR